MNNPAPHEQLSAAVATPPHRLPASPFHPGEQAVQTWAGVRDKAESLGQRMLTAELVDAQRAFFAELSFVVAAFVDTQVDDKGRPQAELVTGPPGFIEVSDAGNARISRANNNGPAAPGAALWSAAPGSPLGLLGIDLARRRRNRINGTVIESGAGGVKVRIDQGYGNCPKYITRRPWDAVLFAGGYTQHRSSEVTDEVAALIGRTDTFFIASSSGPTLVDSQGSGSSFPSAENKPGTFLENIKTSAWGADVSHRGGDPGFLAWDGRTLSFDDYPGNNLFNTLGNLQQYPACGLLLMDFATGDIVQIAGFAKLSRQDKSDEDPGDDRRGGHFRVSVTVTDVRHWQKEKVSTC